MAKRFTVIDLGDKQVVKSGFIEPDFLPQIDEFITLSKKTSIYEEIKIVILHLIFLDIEGTEITDATDIEVVDLQKKLPEFYDFGCIVTKEVIEIAGLYGILDKEEYVEMI